MMGSTISAKGCEDCRAEPLYSRREREREREKGCPFWSRVQRKSYTMIGEENGGEAKGYYIYGGETRTTTKSLRHTMIMTVATLSLAE